MAEQTHDLVIIGAGPAGYTAAIRASQLGLNVACVEKDPRLGGTCLRVGCIPSKALLESSELYHSTQSLLGEHGLTVDGLKLDLAKMLGRKDTVVQKLCDGIAGLFKKNKVTRYTGTARIVAPGKVEVTGEGEPATLNCKNILIATGSKPFMLPGIEPDWDLIGSSTEALTYPEVPKTLVVIGAGVIGLELGSVWNRLGSKVIVLEYLDRIFPEMDTEIATEARKIFTKQGLDIRTSTRVTGAKVEGKECVVTIDGGEPIRCDRVLVSVGRIPNTEGLGLEDVGVQVDKRGRIHVDSHFQTNVPGIYAVGDVIAGPMLAHKAEEEGVACVENLVRGYGHINYNAIPSIVYTSPEVASVGATEEKLKADGIEYRKGSFPFMANARARAIAATEGKVKVLADAKTDRILGVHIIGAHAGDLIAEAAVAINFGASSEDLARSCHAHPTLAEAIKEASLAVTGKPINI
jgi:dihydrolipoamide dehydrogenase